MHPILSCPSRCCHYSPKWPLDCSTYSLNKRRRESVPCRYLNLSPTRIHKKSHEQQLIWPYSNRMLLETMLRVLYRSHVAVPAPRLLSWSRVLSTMQSPQTSFSSSGMFQNDHSQLYIWDFNHIRAISWHAVTLLVTCLLLHSTHDKKLIMKLPACTSLSSTEKKRTKQQITHKKKQPF